MLGSTWRRRGRAGLVSEAANVERARALVRNGMPIVASWRWGGRVVPRKKKKKTTTGKADKQRLAPAAIENPKRNGGGWASLLSASMKTGHRDSQVCAILAPAGCPILPPQALLALLSSGAASLILLALSQQLPCFNNVLPTSDATSTAQHHTSLAGRRRWMPTCHLLSTGCRLELWAMEWTGSNSKHKLSQESS